MKNAGPSCLSIGLGSYIASVITSAFISVVLCVILPILPMRHQRR